LLCCGADALGHPRSHLGAPGLAELRALLHDDRHLGHHLLAERRLVEEDQLFDLVVGEIFVENRDDRFLQLAQRFLEFFGTNSSEIVPRRLRYIGVDFL